MRLQPKLSPLSGCKDAMGLTNMYNNLCPIQTLECTVQDKLATGNVKMILQLEGEHFLITSATAIMWFSFLSEICLALAQRFACMTCFRIHGKAAPEYCRGIQNNENYPIV
jgi:hypothetical protein